MIARALGWTLVTGTVVVLALRVDWTPAPPVADAAGSGFEPAPPQVEGSRAIPVTLAPSRRERAREAPHAEPRPEQRTAVEREGPVSTLYTFDLRVTDGDDQPLSGAAVYLAPADRGLNLVGWTDSRGRLRCSWRAVRESLRVAYACEHPLHGSSNLKLVELTAQPFAAAIQLRSSPEPLAIPSAEAGERFAPRGTPVLPAAAPELRWKTAARARAQLDEQGLLHFVAPLGTLPGTRLALPQGRSLPADPPAELHALAAEEAATFVRGTLSDSRGSPEPLARVRASDAERHLSFSTRTQSDGSFGLGPLPARGMHLSFGGADFGRYETELGRSSELVQVFHPALQRGRELCGRLLDREGQPLSHWKLELAAAGASGPWADVSWTDGEGRFRVPNVPSTMLRLDAFEPGSEDTLPAGSLRSLWAGGDQELALDARAGEDAGLALRLIDDDGRAIEDAEVRLVPEDGDRGTLLEYDLARQGYHASGLASGRYRLAIQRPGERTLAWPGALALEDQSELDLGPLSFERKGRVCIEPAGRPGALEYELERTDLDPPCALGAFRARGRWVLELPAGSYTLSTQRGEVRRSFDFEIEAGRVRGLSIDPR